MGTTLVNPSGGGTSGMDQIDQAFGKMFSMFGPASGGGAGGGTGSFGLQPQPVSGGNNDLTQYQRSLTNLAGTTGAGLIGAGTGLVGGSLPIIQSGTDVQAAGLGPVQQSLTTLQPTIDFYNKLLSGDPQATAQALGPTASNLAAIYAGAANQGSQGQPQGGFRASTIANLPYAQAQQVGNAALQLQPAAARDLQQAAAAQSGIGATEAGIGQGISQTGLGVGQLGTVLTGQGLQTLQNTIADVLQKMGINIQGGTSATFSQIVGSL